MSSYLVDINADVGEGLNNEPDIMPYLSSCNIACGGHAGDLQTMTHVVRLAKMHKVKIGAHPSFPDKENFGRSIISISSLDLFDSIMCQVIDLYNIVEEEGARLNHIKPHGALYNLAAKDEKTAKIILNVLQSFSKPLKLYAPPKSAISKLAKFESIEVVSEAFADRNYNDDLSLVSRKSNSAILNDKNEVLNHVLRVVKNQKVKTISGVEVPIKASTFCVHGDTKNALEILRYLNQELPKNNVNIQ